MLKQLPDHLQRIWQQQGYNEPTEIQEKLYAPMVEGQSIIAHSPTGTGKTLAYLLPILQRIEANKQLQAIILAPSQELAKQIYDVAAVWAKPSAFNVQLIIGGANIKRQIDDLKEKPEIIVATPGRLIEVMNQTRKIKLHQLQTVVFDEADYLILQDETQQLNPMIANFTKRLMRDVAFLFISATQNEALNQVAHTLKDSLMEINIENMNEHTTHLYLEVNNRRKDDVLRQLAHLEGMYGIIFFEQIAQLEQVAAKLLYNGVPVSVLHGDLGKMERQVAMTAFREGKTVFLLTTDLASRGIDVPNVSCVIHYNRVADLETYIHRSGRTGRMGKQGVVVSLVNQQEYLDLSKILQGQYHLEHYILYQGALMPEQMALEVQQTNRQQAKTSQKKRHKKRRKK